MKTFLMKSQSTTENTATFTNSEPYQASQKLSYTNVLYDIYGECKTWKAWKYNQKMKQK